MFRQTLTRPAVAVPLLAAISLLLYANTLRNGYVYDDVPLFTENEYVQRGWAGIPAILTTDSFDSQHRQANSENRLVGGRYRPLALATFAIETALFGQVAWISHLVNVVLFAAVVVALYLLARRLFPDEPAVWLVFGLVFAAHPIHVEVVANVKSRDELLSLLFMTLTCLTIYRSCAAGAAAFVLALLAKEYAAALVMLVPLYGRLTGEGRRALPAAGLLTALLGGYVLWRLHWVGWPSGEAAGILNHPYRHATPLQAFATKLLVLGGYLRMLVWPYPQSYDYSYRQIPYTDLGDPRVWLAAILYAGIAWLGWTRLRRKDPAAFVVFWFLGTMALVSNLVVNAATIQAERLVFHASAGALLAAAATTVRWARRHPASVPLLARVGAAVLVLAAWRVVDRNADWRDEATLFIGDAHAAPNSALVCGNAGGKYLDLSLSAKTPEQRAALLALAREFSERAFRIDPTAAAALNLALIQLEHRDVETAHQWWTRARTLDPGHPAHARLRSCLSDACVDEAVLAARRRRWDEAEAWLKRALTYDDASRDAWRCLGGVFWETGRADLAREAWRRTEHPVVWDGF